MSRQSTFEAMIAKRLEQDAKREARAAQLAPEIVSYWTKYLRRAAVHVTAGKRPCDYTPWINALRKARDMPPLGRDADDHFIERNPDLMFFARTLARPGWPEGREDVIDFALLFLEADVMLFGSGYAKRHMIRRLQQSTLSDMQIARVALLLQRAVIEGTGLEEFRAYKRLSAHLVVKGHLPLWESSLKEQAKGALLAVYDLSGADYLSLTWMTDRDRKKLLTGPFWRAPKWGISWPDTTQLVELQGRHGTAPQRSRRNAYLMLDAIVRRRGEALI